MDLPSLGSLLWDTSFTLRTWAGYKDNPQLSALNPRESGLMAGGAEFVVMRLPVDGREVSVFGMVEHVRYWEDELTPETVAVLDGRFRRRWDDGWSAGASLEYFYLRQVFDASEIVGIPVVTPAEGHTVTVRPVVGRELGAGWRAEVEIEGSRQWLAAPLDSFWDLGPRLAFLWAPSKGSELGLSYRYRRRVFDERTPVDAEGYPVPGTLAFDQHEWEVAWRRSWDPEAHWRTVLRPGLLESLDNGSGYFDYHRLQLAGTLRYVRSRWELRAEAKARWYLYPVQTAQTGDSTHRRRADLILSTRGEVTVRKGVRLFAEYGFESSDENVPASDYRVNSPTAGVEVEW